MRSLLIIVHSVAGTLAFALGAEILRRKFAIGSAWFLAYLGSLVIMTVFLIGALVVDWNTLEVATQVAFAALVLLAISMVVRAVLAGRAMKLRTERWQHAATHHIGFTLISLFIGFVIIFALNSGFPEWTAGLFAVAALLAGREAVTRVARSF